MIEVVIGIQTSLDADRTLEIVTAALAQQDPDASVEIDDWFEVAQP